MVQCLDLTTYAGSITGVDEGLYRHKGGFRHRLAYAHTPPPKDRRDSWFIFFDNV